VPAETVTVRVTGPDGDAGDRMLPLTWAQTNMWDASWGFGADAATLANKRTVVPGRAVSVPEALDAVATVFARYDVARTTFVRHGRQQRVNAAADLSVAILDASDDPVADEQGLLADLCALPFAHEDETPVRVGLIRAGSRVQSVAMAVSHLAFDGHGAWLLRDALAAELAAEPPRPGEPPAQTSWLVADEASEASVERSTVTINRWRKAMAKLPAGRGIALPVPGTYSMFSLRSAALAIAAQALAVRTETTGSSVILAALCAALRDTLPSGPAALQVIAGNRHRPGLSDFVGITVQNGLFVIPPAAGQQDFASVIQQSHRSGIWAYRNARYNTRQLRDAILCGQERGDFPDLSYFFNHVRRATTDWPGLEKQRSALGALRQRETHPPALVGQRSIQDATLFLHLLPAGTNCSLLMVCDDKLIDHTASVAILDRIRDIVVSAALGTDPHPSARR
jgi:hypothetical protein